MEKEMKYLEYLNNKPKRIDYQIIAGPPVPPIQRYDLVFDDYDLKIRGIGIRFKDL